MVTARCVTWLCVFFFFSFQSPFAQPQPQQRRVFTQPAHRPVYTHPPSEHLFPLASCCYGGASLSIYDAGSRPRWTVASASGKPKQRADLKQRTALVAVRLARTPLHVLELPSGEFCDFNPENVLATSIPISPFSDRPVTVRTFGPLSLDDANRGVCPLKHLLTLLPGQPTCL